MNIKTFIFALLCAFQVFFSNAAAHALETGWQSADYVQARLLSGHKTTGGDDGFQAALEIRLSEDWHAYWRMPGEGGLPPHLNWEKSENLASVDVLWPAPMRFETFGLYSFGYERDFMLPLKVTAADPSKPVVMELAADIMVCKDICVPQKVQLRLDVPAGAAKESKHMALIERVMNDVPHEGNLPSLKIENAVIGPEAVVVNAYAQKGFERADLFVEAGEDIYVTAPPEITLDKDDPRYAMIRVAAPEGVENLANELIGSTITLTLSDGQNAIEKVIDFQ